MEPKALLLDEPNIGLDYGHSQKPEEVLLDSNLDRAIVSHDQELLEHTCSEILFLRDGFLKPLPD